MLVRAAVDGVVDFSQMDVRDKRWHTRLSLILDEMLRRDKLKDISLSLERKRAYLQAFSSNAEVFNKLAEEEQQLLEDYYDIYNGRQPIKQSRKVRMAKTAMRAWAAEFGELDDTETQRKIDAVADGLKSLRTGK